MRAAYYEQTGPAERVLVVGDLPDPQPAADEVRVRLEWSGVNPSDVKARSGARGPEMPFPRVIPHSDGMGVIDAVGAEVCCRGRTTRPAAVPFGRPQAAFQTHTRWPIRAGYRRLPQPMRC